MKYYQGLIKKTEFFTTNELAEKLKMNQQVITRKVQSGEIAAYKIGKDWRIPEESVFAWLQTRSNQQDVSPLDAQSQAVATNRLKNIEATKVAKVSAEPHLLEYILAQFDPDRDYSLQEIDRIIGRYHTDPSTIRDALVSNTMLRRKGTSFRRLRSFRLSS